MPCKPRQGLGRGPCPWARRTSFEEYDDEAELSDVTSWRAKFVFERLGHIDSKRSVEPDDGSHFTFEKTWETIYTNRAREVVTIQTTWFDGMVDVELRVRFDDGDGVDDAFATVDVRLEIANPIGKLLRDLGETDEWTGSRTCVTSEDLFAFLKSKLSCHTSIADLDEGVDSWERGGFDP